MKKYMVGGAVRDILLGETPKDIDYVVVGETPDTMKAAGFEQVGQDFPVFLKDGDEYALARSERQTGVGYTGFTFEYARRHEDYKGHEIDSINPDLVKLLIDVGFNTIDDYSVDELIQAFRSIGR